jgi:hypothetical protein
LDAAAQASNSSTVMSLATLRFMMLLPIRKKERT